MEVGWPLGRFARVDLIVCADVLHWSVFWLYPMSNSTFHCTVRTGRSGCLISSPTSPSFLCYSHHFSSNCCISLFSPSQNSGKITPLWGGLKLSRSLGAFINDHCKWRDSHWRSPLWGPPNLHDQTWISSRNVYTLRIPVTTRYRNKKGCEGCDLCLEQYTKWAYSLWFFS